MISLVSNHDATFTDILPDNEQTRFFLGLPCSVDSILLSSSWSALIQTTCSISRAAWCCV